MGGIIVKNSDTQSTPPSGKSRIYPKTDKKWYSKDDTGTEIELGEGATPASHATSHTDGTDDIQDATSSQKGLATAAQITKLDGVEAGADVTDATNVASAGAQMTSEKNAANGYPGLSAGSKITGSQQTYGSSADTACEGNDSRLSDARTPTAHNTSHQSGGSDAIKLDDMAAPDDNTDLNATTSAHGLLPKLGGGTTNFLRADGTWNAPAGGSSAHPKKHIDGFTLTRTSNTQLQISAGEARDSADAYDIDKATTTTVDITSSGANGLDTGTEASSTPYYIYMCTGSSGECGLISASSTPTLPSGYNNGYRQVGSWYNASDGHWALMAQLGSGRMRLYQFDEARDSEMRCLLSGDQTSWSEVDYSDWIPSSAIQVQFTYMCYDGIESYPVLIRPGTFTNSLGLISLLSYLVEEGSFWLANFDETLDYMATDPDISLSLYIAGYREEV